MVGSKGARGLPGPPGKCSCGAVSHFPYDDYSSRGLYPKVPAVRNYVAAVLVLSLSLETQTSCHIEASKPGERSASLLVLFVRSSL